MKTTESKEMYLKTIYQISQNQPFVRSIDVAEKLKFSKPSVSRAMRILKENDLIIIDDHGLIQLTPNGLKLATILAEKESVLASFFISLGASKKSAHDNACRIEHVISEDLYTLIKNHLKK